MVKYIFTAEILHTTILKLMEALNNLSLDVNIEIYGGKHYLKRQKKNNKDSDKEKETEKDTWAGIKIKCLNKEATTYAVMSLKDTDIHNFDCIKKQHVIGVNLSQFTKITKLLYKESKVMLYMETDNKDELKIRCDNSDRLAKNYTIPLIEVRSINTVPQFNAYDIMIDINDVKLFHNVCKDSKTISNYAKITYIDKELYFHCKNENGSISETVFKSTSENDLINIKPLKKDKQDKSNKKKTELQAIQGTYDLLAIDNFSKITSIASSVVMLMKEDSPLILKYPIINDSSLYVFITQIEAQDMSDNDSDSNSESDSDSDSDNDDSISDNE